MNSNSNNERFERIERAIEALANQSLAANQKIESNAKAIEALANENRESISALAEVSGRTLRAVDLLREAQEEDRANFQEFKQLTQEQITSISAAVERLEAILNNLIGRD